MRLGVVGGVAPVGAADTIEAIRFVGLTPGLEQQVERELGIRAGDTVQESIPKFRRLATIDEHLSPSLTRENGQVTLVIAAGTTRVSFMPPPVEPPTGAVQVAPEIAKTMLIQQTRPTYPPIARQARIQGVVRLSVVVGAGGNVEQISVVSGPAMLRDVAMEAVRQWLYTPMRVNGSITPFVTEVEVNFTLL